MNIESFNLKRYKKLYFVLLDNKVRSLKLDEKLLDFKKKIIISQLKSGVFEAELLDENSFKTFAEKFNKFDVAYPTIGENFSF